MNQRNRNIQNRSYGETFERILLNQARLNGLLAIKNPLGCRPIGNGNLIMIKSNLDYHIINKSGYVGYFDCKCFEGSYFTYSQLDEKQRERAVQYNNWGVPAGFIVWLRESGDIVYFKGEVIKRLGPRTRFNKENGLFLGQYQSFDLKPILEE